MAPPDSRWKGAAPSRQPVFSAALPVGGPPTGIAPEALPSKDALGGGVSGCGAGGGARGGVGGTRVGKGSQSGEAPDNANKLKAPILSAHQRAVVAAMTDLVYFKRTKYVVVDNRAAVPIAVLRSKSSGKLVVRYETTDGSGQDLHAGSGVLTFMHGENMAVIKIPLMEKQFKKGQKLYRLKVRLVQSPVIFGQARRHYKLNAQAEAEIDICEHGNAAVARK